MIEDEPLYSSHYHVWFNDLNVDLVFACPQTTNEVLDRFDVGFARSPGMGEDTISPDFVRDVENKT